MWRIKEHRDIEKTCRGLPTVVVKKYEVWKDIVFRHGPEKLREFPGFHDEKLKGNREGQRLLGGLMRTRGQAEFVPAKAHAKLTTGEVIRMLRELKGWTQAELATRSGISATNISLLENEKVEIGKKRVEQLAKAFDIHPAIIMFPEYEAKEIQKAA